MMDITERKRIEQALAESEYHFLQTLEQQSALLWTSDAEGRVTDMGPQWTLLTGIAREETLGDGWIKGLHPDDAVRAAQCWQESVLTGQPYDIEHRCRRKDGSWLWMRARAMARRGASGEIIQWYGTLEVLGDRRTQKMPYTGAASEPSTLGPMLRLEFDKGGGTETPRSLTT
jgi:PAS domain S-box-containing protein